jgi:hypothetical protein
MTMVQLAWAALGLLAVALFGMLGMFFYLGARIDGLTDRLDARIDSLAALLQAHIERHAG